MTSALNMIGGAAHGMSETASSKHLLDFIVRVKDNFPCRCYHNASDCNTRHSQRALLVLTALLKINIPIHVVPTMMSKLKDFKQK